MSVVRKKFCIGRRCDNVLVCDAQPPRRSVRTDIVLDSMTEMGHLMYYQTAF